MAQSQPRQHPRVSCRRPATLPTSVPARGRRSSDSEETVAARPGDDRGRELGRSDAPAAMDAGLTPQEAVGRGLAKPSECDLTIVVLWARMGTPLSAPRSPMASQYLSGNRVGVLDAKNAASRSGLYRKTARLVVDVEDPELAEKQRQKRLVDQFFSPVHRSGWLAGGRLHHVRDKELQEAAGAGRRVVRAPVARTAA